MNKRVLNKLAHKIIHMINNGDRIYNDIGTFWSGYKSYQVEFEDEEFDIDDNIIYVSFYVDVTLYYDPGDYDTEPSGDSDISLSINSIYYYDDNDDERYVSDDLVSKLENYINENI